MHARFVLCCFNFPWPGIGRPKNLFRAIRPISSHAVCDHGDGTFSIRTDVVKMCKDLIGMAAADARKTNAQSETGFCLAKTDANETDVVLLLAGTHVILSGLGKPCHLHSLSSPAHPITADCSMIRFCVPQPCAASLALIEAESVRSECDEAILWFLQATSNKSENADKTGRVCYLLFTAAHDGMLHALDMIQQAGPMGEDCHLLSSIYRPTVTLLDRLIERCVVMHPTNAVPLLIHFELKLQRDHTRLVHLLQLEALCCATRVVASRWRVSDVLLSRLGSSSRRLALRRNPSPDARHLLKLEELATGSFTRSLRSAQELQPYILKCIEGVALPPPPFASPPSPAQGRRTLLSPKTTGSSSGGEGKTTGSSSGGEGNAAEPRGEPASGNAALLTDFDDVDMVQPDGDNAEFDLPGDMPGGSVLLSDFDDDVDMGGRGDGGSNGGVDGLQWALAEHFTSATAQQHKQLANAFAAVGLTNLLPLQQEVLPRLADQQSGHVLLQAPTGSGKTFAIFVALAQMWLEGGGRALVVGPTNAQNERLAASIQGFLSCLGLYSLSMCGAHWEVQMAESSTHHDCFTNAGGPNAAALVMAPELAALLLNMSWFCQYAKEVELLVGDESDELLGDQNRRAFQVLPLRLAELRKRVSATKMLPRTVLMSATHDRMPSTVQPFLHALGCTRSIYASQHTAQVRPVPGASPWAVRLEGGHRPAPLKIELVPIGGEAFEAKVVQVLQAHKCAWAASGGTGALLLVSSRSRCLPMAEHLMTALSMKQTRCRVMTEALSPLSSLDASEVPTAAVQQLLKLLRARIGIHHSGMHPVIRTAVTKLADAGQLRLLVSTSGLVRGVTFPLSLVVMIDLTYYSKPSGRWEPAEARVLLQGSGRVGRSGQGEAGQGEAVVIAREEHAAEVKRQLQRAECNVRCSLMLDDTQELAASLLSELAWRKAVNLPPLTLDQVVDAILSPSYWAACINLDPGYYGLQPHEDVRSKLLVAAAAALLLLAGTSELWPLVMHSSASEPFTLTREGTCLARYHLSIGAAVELHSCVSSAVSALDVLLAASRTPELTSFAIFRGEDVQLLQALLQAINQTHPELELPSRPPLASHKVSCSWKAMVLIAALATDTTLTGYEGERTLLLKTAQRVLKGWEALVPSTAPDCVVSGVRCLCALLGAPTQSDRAELVARLLRKTGGEANASSMCISLRTYKPPTMGLFLSTSLPSPTALYGVEVEELKEMWRRDGRSPGYVASAIAALQKGWAAELPLITPDAGYGNANSELATDQQANAGYPFVVECSAARYIIQPSYPAQNDRAKAMIKALRAAVAAGSLGTRRGPKHSSESLGYLHWYHPPDAEYFDTVEAAAVELSAALKLLGRDILSRACIEPRKLTSTAHGLNACSCSDCLAKVAFEMMGRNLLRRLYPENFQGYTVGGGCQIASTTVWELLATRIGPGSSYIGGRVRPAHGKSYGKAEAEITLLGGRAKSHAVVPVARPAIACVLQSYAMPWMACFALNPHLFVCAGPSNHGGSCPFEVAFKREKLWGKVLRAPDRLQIPDQRRKNWLQRAHAPLGFELLFATLRVWLERFIAALADKGITAEPAINEELRRSLAFNVFIYWLAGARPFHVAVSVEGTNQKAVLLPNVRFRCAIEYLKEISAWKGKASCHEHDSSQWKTPAALANWAPFVEGDSICRSTFDYLEKQGAARWQSQ